MIGRREFITLLGGAAVAWPLAARGQHLDPVRRIGVLFGPEDDPQVKAQLAAFRYGLDRLGWSDGRNVQIDYRFASATKDTTQVLASELIAPQPDVIFVDSTRYTAAVQRQTRTIPIVFNGVADPIGAGFIASLARPGGNLTGLMLYEASVAGKWLAMLKQIAPCLARVAKVPAIDPAVAGGAPDEMLGFVLRLRADWPPEISPSWDHRLGGSLWTNSGHSLSMTMRISSEMISITSISAR